MDLNRFAGAPPRRAELIAWLAPLVTTPVMRQNLERLVGRVESASTDADGALVCHFGGEARDWTLLPPNPNPPKELPEDLRRVLATTGGSWLGEPGEFYSVELSDGQEGVLHVLGDDIGLDPERDGFGYDGDLIAPVQMPAGHPILWIYAPGSGKLVRFDQEGGVDEGAHAEGAFEAFLHELVRSLSNDLDDFPGEPPAAT